MGQPEDRMSDAPRRLRDESRIDSDPDRGGQPIALGGVDDVGLEGRLRVLAVYHNADTPAARAIFTALGARAGLDLIVLAPRQGHDELADRTLTLVPGYREGYQLTVGEVFGPARTNRGFYRSGLWARMRSFRPHVVHVFDEARSRQYLQAVLFRDLLRLPASVLFFGFDNVLLPPSRPHSRAAWKYLCARGDGGAVASSEARDLLVAHGFPGDAVERTFWAVPAATADVAARAEIRSTLGIAEAQPVIGYMGRLVPSKGVETLIRALPLLPAQVELMLIGNGESAASLQALASALGVSTRTHSVGALSAREAARHLAAIDVLVLPSVETQWWKEQFGRVLAEAMLAGTTVVGSDSGAIPEVIGDAGPVFPAGDVEALAAALRPLTTEERLRNSWAQKGRRRAEHYFTPEAFAERLHQLYQRVSS